MRRTLITAVIAVAGLVVLSLPQIASSAQIFSENFNGFTAPPGNFNGLQFESGFPVAHTGDLPGWAKSGGGAVHAVDHSIQSPPPSADFAAMIWQDNVLTLASGIAGSNVLGQTYNIDYLASPAVYQAPSQQTSPTDGLLIEVLRLDNSVLASRTYLPGAWAGNIVLVADAFSYVGDGSGDVRLRVGPSAFNSGRFGGAIDDLRLTGVGPLFSESFNGFTAPPPNFNGLQFESGLPVAHTGDVPGWSKSGGGAVHAVNHATPPNPAPRDFAPMIWQDNVLTLAGGIAGSNVLGQLYSVDFEGSPAVYQLGVQQTSPTDGLLIEVLRADDSILASYTYQPGAWAGTIALNPTGFTYTGDGSGDVRLRVGPSAFNSGRFGGAIDNLSISAVPEPSGFVLAGMALAVVGCGFTRRRGRG